MGIRDHEDDLAYRNKELQDWYGKRPNDLPENSSEDDRAYHEHAVRDWISSAPSIPTGYENERR